LKTIIIIGTLLIVGFFINSFLEPDDDIKQLKTFTEELNIYAKNKYKEVNGTCTDFTLRQESLTNEEITHSNLNIEIRDNIPVVSNGITAATLTKDDLNYILSNVDEIKKRIDSYISDCAKSNR
jgi:hypothetical protein